MGTEARGYLAEDTPFETRLPTPKGSTVQERHARAAAMVGTVGAPPSRASPRARPGSRPNPPGAHPAARVRVDLGLSWDVDAQEGARRDWHRRRRDRQGERMAPARHLHLRRLLVRCAAPRPVRALCPRLKAGEAQTVGGHPHQTPSLDLMGRPRNRVEARLPQSSSKRAHLRPQKEVLANAHTLRTRTEEQTGP